MLIPRFEQQLRARFTQLLTDHACHMAYTEWLLWFGVKRLSVTPFREFASRFEKFVEENEFVPMKLRIVSLDDGYRHLIYCPDNATSLKTE